MFPAQTQEPVPTAQWAVARPRNVLVCFGRAQWHQTGGGANFGIWANAKFEFPLAAEIRRRSLDAEDVHRAFRV